MTTTTSAIIAKLKGQKPAPAEGQTAEAPAAEKPVPVAKAAAAKPTPIRPAGASAVAIRPSTAAISASRKMPWMALASLLLFSPQLVFVPLLQRSINRRAAERIRVLEAQERELIENALLAYEGATN